MSRLDLSGGRVVPRSLRSLTSIMLIALAIMLAALPTILVMIGRIWAPSTMVQEMFWWYFSGPYVMEIAPYFPPVGHGFSVFVILPHMIANIFDQLSLSDKAHVYVLSVYLVHAMFTLTLYIYALTVTSSTSERLALLLVAFGQGWLMRVTNFRLTANYDLLINILVLALSILCVRRIKTDRCPGVRLAIILGIIAGDLLATKYSLVIVMGPFLFLMLIPWSSDPRAIMRQTIYFVSAVVVTYITLISVYLGFRVEYVSSFVSFMYTYNMGARIQQSTPFILTELSNWMNPNSYYFGFQMLMTVWAILLMSILILGALRRRFLHLSFVLAHLLPVALLSYAFLVRKTAGTMLDISMVLLFSVAILVALWNRAGWDRWVSLTAVSVLLVASVFSVAEMKPVSQLERWTHNSEQTQILEAIKSSNPELPVIYYAEGFPQPIIIPTIELYGVVNAPQGVIGELYRRRLFPQFQLRNPVEGVATGRQIMVIPEYLEVIPETPEIRQEWPQMWQQVDVLGKFPLLAQAVREAGDACQILYFRGEDPRQLHQFWVYPAQVTVCVLNETAR